MIKLRKIMIVDDDSTSLAIGRAFLDGKYEVSLAHSGHQALGALKDEHIPDLILLDMQMPGMNGLDVLKSVKQDERLKDIPVIFLTGDRSVDLEIEGYTNGASGFLNKPVNKYLLMVEIQQHLDYNDLKRENMVLRKRLDLLNNQSTASI